MPKRTVKTPVRKRCPRCGRTKRTKLDFYPDKQNRTGYRTYCKDCLRGKPKVTKADKDKAGKASTADKAAV